MTKLAAMLDSDSTIQSALHNVADTSQRLLLDRLDLFQVEIKSTIQRGIKIGGIFVAAAFFSFVGFIFLLIAILEILQKFLPSWLSWLIIAFLQFTIAGIFIIFGRKNSLSYSKEGKNHDR